MLVFYGKIQSLDETNRIFSIKKKKQVVYFHLTRSLYKKFEAYMREGLYVFVKTYDAPTKHGKIMAYNIICFTKIVEHLGKKQVVYYDIETIKDGVRKLLSKDNYKMFIDLEFTMPPYNYTQAAKEKFYSEIIQYGIYIEDSDGRIIDEREGLIKPSCKYGINDRTCEFLHLTKKKILQASYYSEFYDTLKDLMMLYQPTIFIWGKNDYLMIEKSYEQHKVKPLTSRKNYVNLMQIMKNYYNIKNDIGLFAAYTLLGSNPPLKEQDHNALHDAMATLDIYHLFAKEVNLKK